VDKLEPNCCDAVPTEPLANNEAVPRPTHFAVCS